jgi:hypothetical protein
MKGIPSPKHWYLLTTQHITSQKTVISKELQKLYSSQNIIRGAKLSRTGGTRGNASKGFVENHGK